MKRNEVIQLRVSPGELDRVRREARLMGLSVSEFIREALELRDQLPTEEDIDREAAAFKAEANG